MAGEFVQLQTPNCYPLPTLFTSVPLSARLPLVQSLNDRCFALSSLVVTVNAEFHDQQKRILVVTSEGRKAEDLLPRTSLSASVVAEKDGKRERSGWSLGGRRDFSYYTQQS